MEEILVDKNGYQQYLDKIEELKQLSIDNLSTGTQAYNEAVGDGWHDNFAFEQTMIEDRNITAKINNLLKKKSQIKIVADDKLKKELINIGDVLILEIKYAEDDIERVKIKLTGNYYPNTNPYEDIEEITLNSPLGKAIYKKNINDKDINYVVQNRKIEIKVIERIND